MENAIARIPKNRKFPPNFRYFVFFQKPRYFVLRFKKKPLAVIPKYQSTAPNRASAHLSDSRHFWANGALKLLYEDLTRKIRREESSTTICTLPRGGAPLCSWCAAPAPTPAALCVRGAENAVTGQSWATPKMQLARPLAQLLRSLLIQNHYIKHLLAHQKN